MANFEIPYAGLYFSTPAATTTVADTPIKAAGTTTASVLSPGFAHSNNRLTYNGAGTRLFLVTCTISISAASAADTAIYLALNGTVQDSSEIKRKISTASDNGAVASSLLVWLSAGDYIELWVEGYTSAEELTIQSGGYSITLAG